jgi:hypothetical protein
VRDWARWHYRTLIVLVPALGIMISTAVWSPLSLLATGLMLGAWVITQYGADTWHRRYTELKRQKDRNLW